LKGGMVMSEYNSVTGFLEETIEKSKNDQDYLKRCIDEAADLKVKDYLLKLASIETDLKNNAEVCLTEIHAQIEMEEAIVESYEHF
jgi:hypothetical protein